MRRGQHARQAEKRADREIDARGDDDERHADGDDPGLRHRAHDIGDVVGGEKQDVAVPARREDDRRRSPPERGRSRSESARRSRRDRCGATRRAERRADGARWSCVIHAASSALVSATASTSCSSAPPGNSATVRPRLSTTTRSQRPSSSGISLEAMRTPSPCRGELANAGVNLALGADVDAARRLVEQQSRGSAEHFLGEHDLLLIAARQRADREPPARPGGRRMSEWPCERVHLSRGLDMRKKRRDLAQDRHHQVAPDAVAQHEAAAAPIVGDEAEALRARAADRGEARRRAVDFDHARPSAGSGGAVERGQQLRAPGAHDAGEADDLAGAHFKRDAVAAPASRRARAWVDSARLPDAARAARTRRCGADKVRRAACRPAGEPAPIAARARTRFPPT